MVKKNNIMTGKNFLTALFCTYGYSKNIKIDVINLGYDGILYEMSAINPRTNDEFFDEANGFMFALHLIVHYMKENNVGACSDWNYMPLKSVLNEKERIGRYTSEIEKDKELKKQYGKF